jgi:hypothetical protein
MPSFLENLGGLASGLANWLIAVRLGLEDAHSQPERYVFSG